MSIVFSCIHFDATKERCLIAFRIALGHIARKRQLAQLRLGEITYLDEEGFNVDRQ
jgi:hypothetical protein